MRLSVPQIVPYEEIKQWPLSKQDRPVTEASVNNREVNDTHSCQCRIHYCIQNKAPTNSIALLDTRNTIRLDPFCKGLFEIPYTCDLISNKLSTRRSENDNTRQPLDQWTNSQFIDQQVGNCKSFTLTHYWADLFAMHRGPRSILLCIQRHIQLTSFFNNESTLPFLRYSNFNIFLETPRSRSWVTSKFEVTMCV